AYVIPPKVNIDDLFSSENVDIPHYEFNQYFDQSVFTNSSGGGRVTVAIDNGILTLILSAGFTSTMLSNVGQSLDTEPCLLPDMNLGYINTTPSYNGNSYSAIIENGQLKFTNHLGHMITGFSST